MKRITKISIKPWDREKYPDLYTKTELLKMKLMPAPNSKPRATVVRPMKYGGDYDLYTIDKTVPYRKTKEQKQKEAKRRKIRAEQKKREEQKNEQLKALKEQLAQIKDVENKYDIVVIDFETTGFDPYKDEILQVAIVDQDGSELINELCRPVVAQQWPEAEHVNGITPNMVKNKPPFVELAPAIYEILLSATTILAYNDCFENSFLKANGIELEPQLWGPDPMWLFADKFNQGKRAKLCEAAEYFGYTFAAHDALEDVRATLFLYQKIASAEYSLPEECC